MTVEKKNGITDIFFKLIITVFFSFIVGILLSVLSEKINRTSLYFTQNIKFLFENNYKTSFYSFAHSVCFAFSEEIKYIIMISVFSFSELSVFGIFGINSVKAVTCGFISGYIYNLSKSGIIFDNKIFLCVSVIFIGIIYVVLFSAFSSYLCFFSSEPKPVFSYKRLLTNKKTYIILFNSIAFSGIMFIFVLVRLILIKL